MWTCKIYLTATNSIIASYAAKKYRCQTVDEWSVGGGGGEERKLIKNSAPPLPAIVQNSGGGSRGG